MTNELRLYYVVAYTKHHEYTSHVVARSRLEAAQSISDFYGEAKEVRHVGKGEALHTGMEIGWRGVTLHGSFKTTPEYSDISDEYRDYLNSINIDKGYED